MFSDNFDFIISNIPILIAIIGLAIGIKRLNESIKQSKARVLVDLMKSWNDDFLDAGRDIYYPVFEASKIEWYDNRAGSDLSRWESYDAFLTLSQEQGCEKILELKATEESRALYVKILRVFDFFENIAILVERKHVDEDDIMELFGHHIRVFHAFAGGYLRKRRLTQDSNLPAFKGGMLYSNYERLAQKALYPYRRNRQYGH